jgi:hypothetical protein
VSDLYDDGLEALDDTITKDAVMVLVLTLDSEGMVRIACVSAPECEAAVSDVLISAVDIVRAEESTTTH